MKTVKKFWFLLLSAIVMSLALLSKAQTVPSPGITIAVTNTNQLVITVTNGVAYGYYSLYNQHMLGSGLWSLISTNEALDNTNFLVNMNPYFEGFYFVTASTNWNNNGIPNWDLADPNNPGLGALTVSIVSPAQGTIIQ